MNKELIYSIVKDYFSLEKESLEKFYDRLYNPVIDDVYKSFNLDENNRRYWELDDSLFESNDQGWKHFKSLYPTFIKEYNLSYSNFRDNKVLVNKNLVKLQKALVNFYLKNEEVDIFSSTNKSGFGYAGRESDFIKHFSNTMILYRFENYAYMYWGEGCDPLNLSKEDLELTYKKYIEHVIKKDMEQIGTYKMPNNKLYLVLSCNFEDWFFCSTGESWTSCLGLNSSYGYWSGLPGLITDTNRAMIYITNKEQKYPIPFIDKKYHLDKIISRSWFILDESNRINLVKFYPSSFLGIDTIEKVMGSSIIKTSSISIKKSKNKFDLLFFENNSSLSIYQDTAGIHFEDDNKGYYIFSGCGIQFYHKKLKRSFEGSFISNVTGGLEGLVRNNNKISDYLVDMSKQHICSCCGEYMSDHSTYTGSDGREYCSDCFYENFAYCEYCGEVVSLENSVYVDNVGDLCNDCFEENFVTCSDCDNIISIREFVETNDGRKICQYCRDRNYIECSSCNELFHSSEIKETDNGCYCESCLEERKNNSEENSVEKDSKLSSD